MAEKARSNGRFFYGWVIVLVGSILTFLCTGFYSHSRGVFLPSLAEDLAGGSRFEIAVGFSIAAVTSALSALFIGGILDKYSPKKVILTGMGLVTTSYLLLSICQNLIQFYLVIGIGMGLGMTCMGNLAWHRTVISSFDHWRGRAIFLGVLGASLAGVVMPPLVTNLVEAIGWRGSFVVFAIIVPSILIPLVIFFLKNRHEDIGEVRDGHAYSDAHKSAESADETETRIWHWKEMIRFPTSWSVGLTFGSMGCVYSAIMLHLFGHLKDIGLPGSEAAAILSATALFAALGKTIVGWISDFLAPG